jgi:hypothetical protein
VAAVLSVAGCASRPSEEDLAASILEATAAKTDIDLSEATAACIARELLASGLSDTTLAGLAEDFDAPEVLETEIDDVDVKVTEAASVCQQEGQEG